MKYIIVLLFLFLGQLSGYGQNFERNIQWLPNHLEKINDKNIHLLSFKNALYENPSTGLPYYFEQFEMLPTNNDAKIEIISTTFEPLTSEQLNNIENTDSIPSSINFRNNVVYSRKKPSLQLSFIPLRRNPTTGSIEKLVSFSFRKTENFNQTLRSKSWTYAQNSVLSTGKWVKLKISQTGIYKLTYSQLTSLGFQNPDNIKVFGNGGKILPVNNSIFRYDDLIENAIWFEKGNDGIFNMGDYILFYAHAPVYWTYDATKGMFLHSLHPYSDDSFYFITDNGGASKTIQTLAPEANSPLVTINRYNDYTYHESEAISFLKSGKLWLGESFNIILSHDFPFVFSNIAPNETVKLLASVYGRANVNNTFSFKLNGASLGNATCSLTQLSSVSSNYANNAIFTASVTSSSSTQTVGITYNKPAVGGEGWLDYIDLNIIRNLTMQGGQVQFRDISSVSANNIAEFQLSNANTNTIIWDVTNPLTPSIVPSTLNGSTLSFIARTDTLHEYMAFDKTMFYSPVIVGEIANQNLHATPATDMVIVSHPNFLSYAQTLAEHHRNNDNLSVLVVTPEEIYNEFSSGSVDVSAIKGFMKMFYDRAGSDTSLLPKYLLLYGDGSFDNRHNFSSNTNFIPTFESSTSLSPTNSFTTDDFYGLLEDSEGDYIGNLDIGVGRLPVKNTTEAQGVLNKILNYVKYNTQGDWKNSLTFIGDDEDSNEHMQQANSICTYIDTIHSVYNVDKIYLDAYNEISTPNGNRYPDVNTAIANKMKKGTFIVNYTGHGNEVGLAHEHIIGVSDINSWTNFDKLPLFITATCEFSRYDDYDRTSAGEMVILNPNGGAISMFTTTRLVYSNSNFIMNQAFIKYLFKKDSQGNYYRLGDSYRLAKNATASDSDINKRNFSLLGDPAIMLSFPKYVIKTDSINGIHISAFTDTLHSLQKVTIKGHVESQDGSLINGYNGILYPTVFDKAINMVTLGNNGNTPFPFKQQNNILFKGKASVTNSYFEFTFIVPRDIQYNIALGKISYYAENNTINDAHGYENTFLIGGNSTGTITDNLGPRIELFMNDENFVYGGITNEDPDIYSKLSDDNGINTVGNGIGHDITAVIDENTNQTIVLNEYYEGDLNNYKSGLVRYPLSSLSNGHHTLTFKAWDVCNNSSIATTEFVVAEAQDLTIDNLLNYPNPFTTNTSFYFDHNQPNTNLDVLIQVFTVTGKLVKSISTTMHSNSFHSSAIPWDGLDDYGDKIGKGVYVYKLSVKTADNMKEEKFEKLVILR